jgi:hypothetical protein
MTKADFKFQRKSQASNNKLQLSSNKQNPNIKTKAARLHVKIGIWYLFVIWSLLFGALNRAS